MCCLLPLWVHALPCHTMAHHITLQHVCHTMAHQAINRADHCSSFRKVVLICRWAGRCLGEAQGQGAWEKDPELLQRVEVTAET